MWQCHCYLSMIGTVLGGLTLSAFLLHRLYPWLKYDFKFLQAMSRPLIIYSRLRRQGKLLVDLFEDRVKEHPRKTFLIFQDNNYSYEFAERQVNKVAHVAKQLGLRRGDTVDIMMYNEPALIFAYIGLAKLGIHAAFLNTNLRSKSLQHCINVSEAKTLIVGHGEELLDALCDIRPQLQSSDISVYVQGASEAVLPEGFASFDELLTSASEAPIPKSERDGIGLPDTLCYIFTSGTTGLPKPAVVSHCKALKGTTFLDPVNGTADDVIYSPLPLYHSAALLIALGSTIGKGATVVLRRKFSATHYWEDCRKHNVTITQYIGELCRYLLARPPSPNDGDHKIRIAIGNGLRLDIWKAFQERFAIPQIGEYYAATECNVIFYNFYHKVGAVGRLSPFLRAVYPVYFIEYDYETAEPIRDENGHCIPARMGEPGLMISKIKRNMEYDGYRGEEMTQRKILRNVFNKGDMYYNSGDLFTLDKDYFLYFSDRIGDTFRWKGENISTIEVSNVLADMPWVEDANVYGVAVPGQEGRTGMAALVLTGGEKLSTSRLEELYHKCAEELPAYARPRFLRLPNGLTMTGTLKQCKVELVKEGFHPGKCKGEPLYCMDAARSTYVPLSEDVYQEVLDGRIKI